MFSANSHCSKIDSGMGCIHTEDITILQIQGDCVFTSQNYYSDGTLSSNY